MSNTLQERYAREIDKRLRAQLVVSNIVNHRFEGDPKAGSVKIPYHNTMTAATYSKTTGTTLTYGDTAYLTLSLNDIAVNELIDGFEAVAVPDNYIANKIEDGAYALALKSEQLAISELETNATAANDTTASTSSTAFTNVVTARTALSTAKVPTKGRWLLVSPSFYALLLQDANFVKKGDLSQELVATGAVGEVAGFIVYECLNLTSTTEFIAGNVDWFAEVNEWAVMPAVKDLADGVHVGSSALQGRKVVGYKLTQATAAYIKKNA